MAPARWEHNPRLHHAWWPIAALRHGEAAGLRWKHYDPNTPSLGRLVVATSYDKGHTKTKRTRYMPVHPHATGLPES
jgi:integrase